MNWPNDLPNSQDRAIARLALQGWPLDRIAPVVGMSQAETTIRLAQLIVDLFSAHLYRALHRATIDYICEALERMAR